MHLGHRSRLGRPVVLFEVDVCGVVARPRRQDALVPKALQVGRYAGRAGTGDEQIAAILEVECLKGGIEDAFIDIFLQHSLCSFVTFILHS